MNKGHSAAKLVVDHISHRFEIRSEEPLLVLDDVHVEVGDRQFVTIVGPSGCGKSTLFNVIAGLIEPSEGAVLVNGEPFKGTNPYIAYMLQKDLLLDWRDVLGNVVIGAEILGIPKDRVRSEAMEWIDRFGLHGFEKKYPFTLSGGMRQRVALLRTLLTHREVLLLDEPFGSLDAQTRAIMQEFLLGLWDSLDRTILFVTHDVEEALILGDEVYVMTARPMRVKSRIPISLPRPRSFETISSPEFIKLKAELMQMIHEESLRAADQQEARIKAES
jgi:ABC-type nitrate/sulfonate/bicarbonate transport system ATPase subunit